MRALIVCSVLFITGCGLIEKGPDGEPSPLSEAFSGKADDVIGRLSSGDLPGVIAVIVSGLAGAGAIYYTRRKLKKAKTP